MKRALMAIAVFAALTVAAIPAAAQARTYYPDCAAKQQYKPHTVVVFCGDAGLVLNKMSWYHWGASEARGRTRSAYANGCTPNCALGKFHRYRARVVLQRPRTCSTNGRKVFTRMAVVWTGTRPAGFKNFTQKLSCKPLGDAAPPHTPRATEQK